MAATEVKYPDIEVPLTGQDGNAMAIMSRVARALAEAGKSADEVNTFYREAMSGDYDNVIATCGRWVTIS